MPKPSPQELARLYLAGHSVGKVAALAKEPPARIRRLLVQLGVTIRPRGAIKGTPGRGKLTPGQREQLRADLRSGQFPSMPAIALKYGVTRECVRLYAAASGVTRYNWEVVMEAKCELGRQRRAACAAALADARTARKAAREALRRKMAALWQSGMRIREIAPAVGLKNERAVCTWLARFRKLTLADFPYRAAERCTSQEARERERAQAARGAALRESYRMCRAWLAELWKSGATIAEIASTMGVSSSVIKARLDRYRQRFPADFPLRQAARGGSRRKLGSG